MANPSNNRKKNVGTKILPKVSLVFMGFGAVTGYLGSEFVLFSRSHPLHWLAC